MSAADVVAELRKQAEVARTIEHPRQMARVLDQRADQLEAEAAATAEPLAELLRRAEFALRALAKAALVVAPTLRQPYRDAPDTSPWDRFVYVPAHAAYSLAAEIRAALPR